MGINIINSAGKRQNTATDIGVKIIDGRGEEEVGVAGGTADQIIVEVEAAENISKYQLVTSDGLIANSGTTAHKNKVIGVATADTLTGFMVPVLTYGELENLSWAWSTGSVFLNGTAISSTPPSTGFSKIIGTIKAPTKILVNLEESILL